MNPVEEEYKQNRFRDLLDSAFGASKLTKTIIEMLMQMRVQRTIAGMNRGDIVFKIKDGICIAVEPHVEFRRGYEIVEGDKKKT